MRITPEDQATLKKKFPKFSKITACMCNNPEYGVSLSPAAKRWLNHAKTPLKSNVKSKVVSARVNDREKAILSELARELGVTVGELIKKLIEEKINDKSVCEGLSEQEGRMPDGMREVPEILRDKEEGVRSEEASV